MLYKMKATTFKGNAVEYTYTEVVDVRFGIAICKTKIGRDALFVRGYNLVEEIPVELERGKRIPDEYYGDVVSQSRSKEDPFVLNIKNKGASDDTDK